MSKSLLKTRFFVKDRGSNETLRKIEADWQTGKSSFKVSAVPLLTAPRLRAEKDYSTRVMSN